MIQTKANWNFSVGKHSDIINKIKSCGESFESKTSRIFKGSSTGNDKVFLLNIKENYENTMLVVSEAVNVPFEIEKAICRPFIYGEDVLRYSVPKTDKYLLFPYVQVAGKYELMDIEFLRKEFPLAFSYLEKNKDILLSRKTPLTQETYYKYSAARSLNEYEQCKILIPDMLVSNRIGFDPDGRLFTGPAIHCPVFKGQVENKTFLAILNSKLFWFFISNTSTALRGNAYRLTPEFLNVFAFPEIRIQQQAPIISLVDRILSAKKSNPQADTSALEHEIDLLVYDLYGLTPDEIAIVEGTNNA